MSNPTVKDGQAPITAAAGNQTAGGQADTIPEAGAQLYRAFSTQQDYDNEAARIRGAAEREATKTLLKALGLQPGDENKLGDFKKAYEESLTEAEKTAADVSALRETNGTLTAQLEDAQYVIAALTHISGKTADDVNKLVRMARGLKDADTTVEQAIEQVLSMTGGGANMPAGTPLLQPDPNREKPDPNPFIPGEHFNMTAQGLLIKNDPEKARKLAKEAGSPLKI